MNIHRRSLIKYAATTPLVSAQAPLGRAVEENARAKADYTLRVGTGVVEFSPEHIVSTTIYNRQIPGPLLRSKKGQRVVVDIQDDTNTPELVHWHGQTIPSVVDGAAEEGTPYPAHASWEPDRWDVLPWCPPPKLVDTILSTLSMERQTALG